MSYCVECGVKLADTEPNCPLCDTPVVNPRRPEAELADAPYPLPAPVTAADRRSRKVSVLTLASVLFLLPAAIVCMVNFGVSGNLSWARYALLGLILAYGYVFPPLWMERKKLRRCIPLYGILSAAACFCLNAWIPGPDWFFTFALPLVALLTAIIGLLAIIVRHALWRVCANAAAIVFASGLFSVYTEFLISQNFQNGGALSWSWYAAATALILGGILLVFDRNPVIRQKLRRKFFI
ncbi:MAG: DUF6320 domain-containing protein [Clostridiales bacterium]|nr:DUF6320 domain-containing protein [Clostridiales bacterium]